MDGPIYIKDIDDILKELDTSKKGLTSNEAARRLEKFGLNKLPDAKRDGYFMIFVKQFRSPLIYVLLAASLVVLYLRDYKDTIVILCVVFVNSIIGMIQEGKAQNTLVALQNLVDTSNTVLRDGKEVLVSEKDIAIGDILILQEGDKVAADARILDSTTLKVDESAFTGESLPVHKLPILTSTKTDLPVSKQFNMLFKGTNIVYGNTTAVVVNTGIKTEIGKLSINLNKIDTEIPLQKNIRAFSTMIIYGIIIISTITFSLGLYLGHSIIEMAKVTVAMAVSIIPEGLPVVITLILARGVWIMSKRNALVKKLQAVEALGQANVIALDKTGTITKNELEVKEVYVNDQTYKITGEGYELDGKVISDRHKVKDVEHQPDLVILAKISTFCANAKLFYQSASKSYSIKGDPTEVAMLVFAEKIGIIKDTLENDNPRKFEIPFDYEKKYHLVVNNVDGKDFLSVAGSPKQVLDLTEKIYRNNKEQTITKEDFAKINKKIEHLTHKGYRVIACATAIDKSSGVETKHDDKFTNVKFSFVGLLAMKDSLRDNVSKSIQLAKNAGIDVVMLTGDNRVTAQNIAHEAGIYKEGDWVIPAEELTNLPESELIKKLHRTSVFAEVTPNDKLKIIEAYRKAGKTCAMTGDGVNDVPPLLAADLSIAMGKIGTEVAKEAADIVLLDDNFESIVAAIEEGRNIYNSITKVIQFLFATSLAEALLIITALSFDLPIPLNPTQIIWLNLMTDSVLVLALALEPNEKGILNRHFERPGKYIIKQNMLFRVLLNAFIMSSGTILTFYFYLSESIVYATSIALTTMVAFQWINVFNFRSDTKSAFDMGVFKNKLLIVSFPVAILMQIVVLESNFFNDFLSTVSIKISDWIIIIAVSFSLIFVEEIRKFVVKFSKK